MENAFTPSPVCSPARASFLTGKLPSQHGIHDYIASGPDFGERHWLSGQKILPEILKGAGYQTGLAGKWHLGRDMEPGPGFDQWFALSGDYPIPQHGRYRYSDNGRETFDERPLVDVVTDKGLEVLNRFDADSPFFLLVGYTATHSPWADHPSRFVDLYRTASFASVSDEEAPHLGMPNLESRDLRPRSRREGLMQYYAAISHIDEGVGRFLAALKTRGLLDDTLIVYTSDHGLNCGQHGIWGKGNGTLPLNMVEESIRVPLILRDGNSARRLSAFVDHMDLFQTLAEYSEGNMKSRSKDEYPGRSFLSALQSGQFPNDWRSEQICEYGTLRMIRNKEYKLLDYSQEGLVALYNLLNDPQEMKNLAQDPAMAETIVDMKNHLDSYFASYGPTPSAASERFTLEPCNTTSPWLA